jgi:transcriptional regulator with XRE-family HTH domain
MTSEELRAALGKLGWSNREFARRVGRTEVTTSRWKHDRLDIPAVIGEYVKVCLLAKNAGLSLPD